MDGVLNVISLVQTALGSKIDEKQPLPSLDALIPYDLSNN